MKKSILRVLSLVLVAATLFACTSCTQTILVRFVDKDGNDLNLGGGTAIVTEETPADDTADVVTDAVVTDAVATDAVATDAVATEATPAATEATPAATEATPAATEAAATTAAATTAAAAGSAMPTSVADIANFYKAAVEKVKNGQAGYTKKEWQAIGDINITGSSSVDSLVANVVAGYMTTEDAAEDQVCAKGSDDAKSRFPGWYVTNMSDISSAKCTKNANGNYNIVIKMVQEDTPKKEGSRIAKFTNSFMAWEDVEAELKNISLIKSYSNIQLVYNLTIEAEITPDGKFVSMTHKTPCEIKIGEAKISIITVKDKSAQLDNTCTYTKFSY